MFLREETNQKVVEKGHIKKSQIDLVRPFRQAFVPKNFPALVRKSPARK